MVKPERLAIGASLLLALALGAPEASADAATLVEGAASDPFEPLAGLDLGLSAGLVYDSGAPNPLSGSFGGRALFLSDSLELVAELQGRNDGRYGPELIDIGSGQLGSISASIEAAGMAWKGGNLAFSAGRLRHGDEVDSPYSLFINSEGPPTFLADIRFDDGRFFYESRWLGLNHDSAAMTEAWFTGFPERGANYRVLGMRIGSLTLGYQDAAVYTGRWFDPEYFISPLPSYFTQYVRSTGGRPWQDSHDDNTLMGGFAKLAWAGGGEAFAQFLLDDFGMGFILPSASKNPWQLAAAGGVRLPAWGGNLAFDCAMATRYTFAPSYLEPSGGGEANPYGYSYYPDTRYNASWSTTEPRWLPFSFEDNEIGYKYGENNLALRAGWKGSVAGIRLDSMLELRLAGSNSLANPWADAVSQPPDTAWLDDPQLEKRISGSTKATMTFGGFVVVGELGGGIAFDALQLRAPRLAGSAQDALLYLWAPTAGRTIPFLRISVGGIWRYGD